MKGKNMQVNGVQSYQGQNCSFRNLKIKNPKKMSNEMLDALIGVKDLFADYPNANVRLKHSNRYGFKRTLTGGAYSQSYEYYWGRFMQSTLEFNLGKKVHGKSIKFSIPSDQVHTSCYGRRETFKSSLPFSKAAGIIKASNYAKIIEHINQADIKENIKRAIELNNYKYNNKQYRKNLLKMANL